MYIILACIYSSGYYGTIFSGGFYIIKKIQVLNFNMKTVNSHTKVKGKSKNKSDILHKFYEFILSYEYDSMHL